MYCTRCGAENREGGTFCTSCGTSFAVPDQGQTGAQGYPSGPQGGKGQPGPGSSPKIPNHLVWAIISIFLFTIGGIVAVIYASRVDSRLAVGDVAAAQSASNTARTWCIISTVVGVIGVVGSILLMPTGF